jgi:hypothetical protein
MSEVEGPRSGIAEPEMVGRNSPDAGNAAPIFGALFEES